MSSVNQVFEAAMKLPDQDRTALIAQLLGSMDGESDVNADAAWRHEINRRIEELDSGEVTPIPWAEAREMILGNIDVPTAN